jgi:hypothetical protein
MNNPRFITLNVVSSLSNRHLSFGRPPTILTTYVSKALNQNIRMLMENYSAMDRPSKTKMKNEHTRQCNYV